MRSPLSLLLLAVMTPGLAQAARPNVVLVITDDQGYGDIAAHGNEMIRTPQMDRLHADSIRLTNFHVDPTCAPTRAALMTGRYSSRSGVWHTIMGRSLMDPREVTMANLFTAGGYRTGQFGKWHLGDNAPLRPQDRGFARTLHHGGGGLTQSPDWWGNDYFDDTYLDENQQPQPCEGYCTDVWFGAAEQFIRDAAREEAPFFCYVATNAPHFPYIVADEERAPYAAAGVPEPMASFYGMITNLDNNLGRLRDVLEEERLTDNTILIFMTDNGTAAGIAPKGSQAAWQGFNAGMRGQKASEYDGGHRVPCFIHWPAGRLTGGRDIDRLTAHIDLLPTLLDLCELTRPSGPPLDGRSLRPLLEGDAANWPDRTVFLHSQRFERPRPWNQTSVMTQRWRLVNREELYDMTVDPGQTRNVAADHPDVVEKLRSEWSAWWETLLPAFEEPVRIDLGNPAQNPTQLCCHDWHTDGGPLPVMQSQVARNPVENGDWAVNVTRPGRYRFLLRWRPESADFPLPAGRAGVELGGRSAEVSVEEGAKKGEIELSLPAGPGLLRCWIEPVGEERRGAYYVDVEYVGN